MKLKREQLLAEQRKKELEQKELEGLTRPCKFKVMPNYVFNCSCYDSFGTYFLKKAFTSSGSHVN